jgi:hypothetical protein
MTKHTRESIEYAHETVMRYAPEGTRVTALVTHVSKSGMSRRIRFFVPTIDRNGNPEIVELTHAFAVVTDNNVKDDGNGYGVNVHGCGMDMRFHIISNVSRALYRDDYKLSLAN